jgi:hypothetical protein
MVALVPDAAERVESQCSQTLSAFLDLAASGCHPTGDQKRSVERSPYGWCQKSRARLFEECESIDPEVAFVLMASKVLQRADPHTGIGHGSRMTQDTASQVRLSVPGVGGDQQHAARACEIRSLKRTCNQLVLGEQHLRETGHVDLRTEQDRGRNVSGPCSRTI